MHMTQHHEAEAPVAWRQPPLQANVAEVGHSTPPSAIVAEVQAGLSCTPKRLSSKFFYDARGSDLFERICDQPEYYLTRTELGIMQTQGADMARALGLRVRLVEFGSGSGLKTRLLLSHMAAPAAYVPVEISRASLDASVVALKQAMPHLEVMPLEADFTQPLALPWPQAAAVRTVVYFPGSTLGNFEPHDAMAILRNIRATVGDEGGALIGIDLQKSTAELEAAYNDRAGVTAEFTLNMLTHLNRMAGTDFDVSAFAHRARYSQARSRIETDLISLTDQQVKLGDAVFHFREHEAMRVEYSHKYSLQDFSGFAAQAGFHMSRCWTDAGRRFAVVYLESTPTDLTRR